MIQVPADSTAAKAGLKKDDVIVACDGKPVRTVNDLIALAKSATGKKLTLTLSRQQQAILENNLTGYSSSSAHNN